MPPWYLLRNKTVINPQITRKLGDSFATGFHQLHCFYRSQECRRHRVQ
jgi:hypothetical protein